MKMQNIMRVVMKNPSMGSMVMKGRNMNKMKLFLKRTKVIMKAVMEIMITNKEGGL